MKAASLFAGIGALDLALRWCGVDVDIHVPDALDLLRIPADVSSPWGERPDVPVGTRSTPEVRRRLRQLGLSAVPQAAVEAWRVLSQTAEVARQPGRQRGWPRAGRWYPGAGGPVECEPRHPVRRASASVPTPTAGDAKGSRRFGYDGSTDRTLTDWVWEHHGPQHFARPEWVEWMMGLEIGWTA